MTVNPSKHPRCVHPTLGLASPGFTYRDRYNTNVADTFERERTRLEHARQEALRPVLVLARYGPGMRKAR